MTAFEVARPYRSWRDGRVFGPWQAGEVVDLDDADADWINRDSPGALAPAGGQRQAPPARDRQARPARNRAS